VTTKRAIDLVGATLGLVLVAPLLLALAVVVCATSPGAPLFGQRRAGRGGREFTMWKLRTMVAGADRMRSVLLAQSRDADWLDLADDPRVTPLGRLLRRTSLDELPQLFNVVRGHMSLVGPRPLPLEEHARIPDWAQTRVRLRPGITGLWQVQGRASVSFQDMLLLDCEYVGRVSLLTDLKILLRTVPAVLTGKGTN
jgi:lipopolysaccharide/colanic/teichoic acid biosynthesis glycosyltransferase